MKTEAEKALLALEILMSHYDKIRNPETCVAFETIRTALESMAKSEWQPIETAPRDGLYKILATKDGHFAFDMLSSEWFHAEDDDIYTHWMPLPPPPITGDAVTSDDAVNQACASSDAKAGLTSPATCKCDIRTKLVGDGCAVCNPEYAAQFAENNLRMQQATVTMRWEDLEKVRKAFTNEDKSLYGEALSILEAALREKNV